MSEVRENEQEQETDTTTTVMLEAALLDYSPTLALKNPFATKQHAWPWSRRTSSSNGGGKRMPAGVIQLVKKAPVSSSSVQDEPTYWLRFRDVSVRNDRDLPLYVILSRVAATSLDANGKMNDEALGSLEQQGENVLLDIGPEGQWRPAVLPCEFEQQLVLFDPLEVFSVAIIKPSAARPPSALPIPFVYGAFAPYTPPQKSAEQLTLESEAVAAALLSMGNDSEGEEDKHQGDTGDDAAKSDALTLDALQRDARQFFRLFDTDKSNSIDFDEYKRMLAYRKINLLESKARRFFQLVDDRNKGYIDEREFVVALYIANYLRIHGENPAVAAPGASNRSKEAPQVLSPSDVFHQLDSDHDEMLNVFEYERAIELLGVPRSTPKQAASVRAHFPVSSAHMTLPQFKYAWVSQIDTRSELHKRGINSHQHPSDTKPPLSLCQVLTKKKHEAERLKQLLLDVIDGQERREVELALKAKAEVVEMDKRHREAEQEAGRTLLKQHRQASTETRTNEAIRERQDKIRRRKERVIKDRQAKEERKLLQKIEREAERRAQLEMQIARELVATKADALTLQKAKSGADAVNLRSRSLKALPETLTCGRDALAALSSVLVLDLAQNELSSLPESIFTHLFLLKSLDMSGNLLETLPVEIGEASDLVTLNLRSNRIKALPASGIRKLRKLKVLDLAFNQLACFGDECEAGGLPQLEELDLSCNGPFEKLTEAVGSLPCLKRLALKGNTKLTRLPSSIQHLQTLVALDCSSCGQLRRIGGSVIGRSLRSLSRIDLSFNVLVSLPEALGQLEQLEALVVRENSLVTLPNTFGELSSLVSLNCEHNQIEKLPRAAFSAHMRSMETLVLSRNKLQELPETIGLLTSLVSLSASNNRLTSIPLELGALVNLRVLNLSWNSIDWLPEEIGCMAALEVCDLSHNCLQQLPASIVLWQRLRLLSCSDNKLASPLTPSVRSLCALEYLDLARNALRVLDACVYELENLQVLNVSGNKLTLLPREMCSGANSLRLRKLDLYRNKLSALPVEFAERLLDQLEVLVIEGNPLTRLPEKWSAKWGLRDQFSTAFSSGYASAETKDWVRDCFEWYPFIVETWQDVRSRRRGYGATAESTGGESSPTCDDVDLLPQISGDEFVDAVKAKMGVDKWKERYRRLALHYYYEFRHTGHATVFHERIGEDGQRDEQQDAAIQKIVLNERNARAERAIQDNKAFRARVNAAYHVADSSQLAWESMETRRKHEHWLIANARQEAAMLSEQVVAKMPVAKQKEAERRRREHSAFMLSLHERTRERLTNNPKTLVSNIARHKYGRIAIANNSGSELEESFRE